MGVGAGAESGAIRPTGYIHITPPDIIYHMNCGGQVVYNGYNTPDWTCEVCKRVWGDNKMQKFSVQDLRDRFYLLPKPDGNTYIIVEDTDGFKTFTRTVTWAEAIAKGLKKIPDPTR